MSRIYALRFLAAVLAAAVVLSALVAVLQAR
jgi:hypothetical protein